MIKLDAAEMGTDTQEFSDQGVVLWVRQLTHFSDVDVRLWSSFDVRETWTAQLMPGKVNILLYLDISLLVELAHKFWLKYLFGQYNEFFWRSSISSHRMVGWLAHISNTWLLQKPNTSISTHQAVQVKRQYSWWTPLFIVFIYHLINLS